MMSKETTIKHKVLLFGRNLFDDHTDIYSRGNADIDVIPFPDDYNGLGRLDDYNLVLTDYAAMAKLFASELCMDAVTKSIQVYGGYGYMMDSPMQRYFRDAQLTTIYEGT